MSKEVDWNELKLRTSLYQMKCCPSCGSESIGEKAIGPSWICGKCNVTFIVTNPSYLKRKKK